MAFSGILKEEDIIIAVQDCLGILMDIISTQISTNHTNTSHRLIQQVVHTCIQTACMYVYIHTPSHIRTPMGPSAGDKSWLNPSNQAARGRGRGRGVVTTLLPVIVLNVQVFKPDRKSHLLLITLLTILCASEK